jgi:hypothetical protein
VLAQQAELNRQLREGRDARCAEVAALQEELVTSRAETAGLRYDQQQLQGELDAAQLAANQVLAEKNSLQVRAALRCAGVALALAEAGGGCWLATAGPAGPAPAGAARCCMQRPLSAAGPPADARHLAPELLACRAPPAPRRRCCRWTWTRPPPRCGRRGARSRRPRLRWTRCSPS